MAMQKAKEIVSSNAVVVFSKSYCPFCVKVKELLQQLGAKFIAVELDKESDGTQVQSALAEWTGQFTVPNVFIGGKQIGGCDTITNLHKDGKLVPMLTEAGAIAAKTGATSAYQMGKNAKFSLKLLVDEKRNKVVLAEADQDFVDVLISLLTLPMGKIASLLENHKDFQTVLACYQNLNKSVADMGTEHFETKACKNMLLSPKSSYENHCRRLKLNIGGTDATKFFICSNYFNDDSYCGSKYTNFNTSICRCGGLMNNWIMSEEDEAGDSAGGVFVKCRSSFIVTDDLNVSVNSIAVIMKVVNDLGYNDLSDLQETLLKVGFEEVLTLLGCLFTSDTPLTCAFLRKPCKARKLKMISGHVQNTEVVEPSSVFSMNVFVSKTDGKILYAECNEDFIDALLSFLFFPLELVCSLSSDSTILGCVGNLCRSPCRRESASKFNQVPDYYSCSNNNMFGFLPSPSPVYECFVPHNRGDSWSCELARKIEWSMDFLMIGGDVVKMSPNNPKVISGGSSGCDTGFMKKNTKFIVSNDLSISPMNSFSTVGLLKKMEVNICDLEEHQISISKAEVISILRASLVSSSALTIGLSNLLVKKPKEEI